MKSARENASYYHGMVVGIVSDGNDPDGLGRVKVRIPRWSDSEESNWARVATFMAGKDRGAVFLPEVDDEVIVMFEAGDPTYPVVIGSLHNGKDTPPFDNSDGANSIRVIKSRSGHVIRFDDTSGSELIEIIDKSEKNSIVIDSANNVVTISTGADVEVSAPDGSFSVEAQEIKLKASGDCKITADGDIKIESSGNMDLSGSEINLN